MYCISQSFTDYLFGVQRDEHDESFDYGTGNKI